MDLIVLGPRHAQRSASRETADQFGIEVSGKNVFCSHVSTSTTLGPDAPDRSAASAGVVCDREAYQVLLGLGVFVAHGLAVSHPAVPETPGVLDDPAVAVTRTRGSEQDGATVHRCADSPCWL